MLFRITSDVHMEQFYHQTVPADKDWAAYAVPEHADDSESVLILAGDICEFQYIMFYAKMFKRLAARFKAVVYVPGNHEYCGAGHTPYGPKTFFYFKELLRKYGKIHLLDNSSVTIEGTKIYGASLWTNYDNNPVAALTCSRMWDYRHGMEDNNNSPRLAVPNDYINRHNHARTKLTEELAKGEELVVVSHFAPSHKSIHERYKEAQPQELNYHFVNNMDEEIGAHPQIKLWIHGHTHTQFDYMIEKTRVICNPRGFPDEDTGHIGELDFIEV